MGNCFVRATKVKAARTDVWRDVQMVRDRVCAAACMLSTAELHARTKSLHNSSAPNTFHVFQVLRPDDSTFEKVLVGSEFCAEQTAGV